MVDFEIKNIINFYFKAKGFRYEPSQPSHREVWKMNLREAEKINRMSGKNYIVAMSKIKAVKEWAESKKLDWNLGTVAKRWLEPNEPEPKKAYYIEGSKKYRARQVEGRWKALIGENWVNLNTQYLNIKDVIIYE